LIEPYQYCLNFLQKNDYDHYISVLLAPKNKRKDLAALYAFNLELFRITHTLKEPLISEIRLRWWHDTIEKGQTGSPLVTALLKSIKRHSLPVEVFLHICETKILSLYDHTILNYKDLENYYYNTESLTIQLACQILESKEISACIKPSLHAGVAQGLKNLIRYLPIGIQQRKQIILQAILQEEKEKYRMHTQTTEIPYSQVTSMIFALTSKHYKSFIEAIETTQNLRRGAFLPIAIIPFYLNTIKKIGKKIFEPTLKLSHLHRQFLLIRSAWTGKFPSY
jgi:phytoene synthase